ncbi:hypothetical protein CVT24_002733 [Panaeolus cyanescens]|uniref:Cytochrome P450 n=1 Tax=Panaeolus cyanescens TaxID=181874 RepID=A0A409XBR6_9AGAR|nr:hypothetical protein CVT24_002733 [Panaeolus cyanescens]
MDFITNSSISLLHGAISAGLAVIFFGILQKRKSRLPPGPRGLPILGNALHMPKETPWLTFAEWSKIYGDVFCINAFRTRVIIVNSMKAAKELFDKRSAIYSDRPKLVGQLCSLAPQ